MEADRTATAGHQLAELEFTDTDIQAPDAAVADAGAIWAKLYSGSD